MMKSNFYIIFIFNLIMFMILMLSSNLFKFHPLILGLLLIFFVVIMCLKMNFLGSSYWYSYILFLVMVGGIMILFMYFTSMVMNNLFPMNLKYFIYFYLKFMFIMIFFMIMYVINDDFLSIFMEEYYEIFSLNFLFIDYNKIFYKNLLSGDLSLINLFIILYLFFTMICCALICLKLFIPLRQMNK